MNLPYYLALPLVAAILFPVGSLYYKRALGEGAGVMRSFFVNNLILGACFLPLLVLEPGDVPWNQIHRPLIVGGLFFLSGLLNFLAIRLGDVSLVTPVLGTKVIFVALHSTLFFGVALQPEHWLAAVLTAAAVFILGLTDLRPGHRLSLTMICALASAAGFGLCDALLQQWAAEFGVLRFVGILFLCPAALSPLVVPWFRAPLRTTPRTALRWVAQGAVITALQAMMLVLTIGFFGDATGVNVVYSSRGLWSVLLVWFAAKHFASTERARGGRTMAWRLAGAALMTVAIVLAVLAGARAPVAR